MGKSLLLSSSCTNRKNRRACYTWLVWWEMDNKKKGNVIKSVTQRLLWRSNQRLKREKLWIGCKVRTTFSFIRSGEGLNYRTCHKNSFHCVKTARKWGFTWVSQKKKCLTFTSDDYTFYKARQGERLCAKLNVSQRRLMGLDERSLLHAWENEWLVHGADTVNSVAVPCITRTVVFETVPGHMWVSLHRAKFV